MFAREKQSSASYDSRRLKFVTVRVYSFFAQDLLETVAVPRLMSSRLSTELKQTTEATYHNIKVADEKKSTTRGIVRNFPLSFSGKAVSLEFLVVEKIPVDIIIGSPTLESLEARLDIGHNFETVNIDGSVVQLGL